MLAFCADLTSCRRKVSPQRAQETLRLAVSSLATKSAAKVVEAITQRLVMSSQVECEQHVSQPKTALLRQFDMPTLFVFNHFCWLLQSLELFK